MSLNKLRVSQRIVLPGSLEVCLCKLLRGSFGLKSKQPNLSYNIFIDDIMKTFKLFASYSRLSWVSFHQCYYLSCSNQDQSVLSNTNSYQTAMPRKKKKQTKTFLVKKALTVKWLRTIVMHLAS